MENRELEQTSENNCLQQEHQFWRNTYQQSLEVQATPRHYCWIKNFMLKQKSSTLGEKKLQMPVLALILKALDKKEKIHTILVIE